MKQLCLALAGIVAIGIGYQVAVAKGGKGGPAPKVKYAKVQAIFDAHCTGCHGAGRPRGGIDLTTYASVMKGGEDGPVVVAKNLKKSPLYQAITAAAGYRPMPPRGPKLAAADLKTVETWITTGAKNEK